MKLIENLAKILAVVLLLFVLIQNAEEKIDLRIFTLFYREVHLAIVLLITLGIGAILGSILLSISILQMKSEIRILNKKNKQLTKELENLRNISVEEIPEEGIETINETKN
jgi:uncharacterized membrane protein YciS (DUF1049 family)